MPVANLQDVYFTRVREFCDCSRYRHGEGAGWRDVMWSEMERRVARLATALVAIGVEPGDWVALLSSTRGEWMEIDLAGLACGAVTVPIYIETGELTPSPKVKRKVFTGRFRREIEEMDA